MWASGYGSYLPCGWLRGSTPYESDSVENLYVLDVFKLFFFCILQISPSWVLAPAVPYTRRTDFTFTVSVRGHVRTTTLIISSFYHFPPQNRSKNQRPTFWIPKWFVAQQSKCSGQSEANRLQHSVEFLLKKPASLRAIFSLLRFATLQKINFSLRFEVKNCDRSGPNPGCQYIHAEQTDQKSG